MSLKTTTTGQAPLSPALRRIPKQTRARKSFERIISAAHRVIREGGAAGFTTNAVAAEAGMSIGSLYEYFPNKDVLLAELYEQKLAHIRSFAANPDDPEFSHLPWPAFVELFTRRLIQAEIDVGVDVALWDMLRQLPGVTASEKRHARWFGATLSQHLAHFGSTWSETARFDLAVYIYQLHAGTWLYWELLGEYSELAIDRCVRVGLVLLQSAFDGSAEPTGRLLTVDEQNEDAI